MATPIGKEERRLSKMSHQWMRAAVLGVSIRALELPLLQVRHVEVEDEQLVRQALGLGVLQVQAGQLRQLADLGGQLFQLPQGRAQILQAGECADLPDHLLGIGPEAQLGLAFVASRADLSQQVFDGRLFAPWVGLPSGGLAVHFRFDAEKAGCVRWRVSQTINR